MVTPDLNSPSSLGAEGIDFDKLSIIFRKNILWIIAIIIVCNTGAYLYLRWTKSIFQSESELKLDIKQDPSEFGIKGISEDPGLNIISGEIEQIRSRLFISRVVDSLDIWVSYHSKGNVLSDEMYRRSPFRVEYQELEPNLINCPLYINFNNTNGFTLQTSEKGPGVQGTLGRPMKLGKGSITIFSTPFYELYHEDDYFFIVHSREDLVRYILSNLTVAPLNFNANTIKITFRDFNALKASNIVNKIDSTYLRYSNELKNQTNRQKISWLNDELKQIEKRMEDFEDYFEDFTLQNRTSDLKQELGRTITELMRIDSQRFLVNKRLADLQPLVEHLENSDFRMSYAQLLILPDFIRTKVAALEAAGLEREKITLSSNENTLAYQQKEKEYALLRKQVMEQMVEYRKELMKSSVDLDKRKQILEREFAGMPDKNTQYSKNQRFYKLYEEFYFSMMQSRAEFEIAQAGSTPDFKILSSATVPSAPISPVRLMIFGIGFSAGIVLSVFFLGILYLLNNRITSLSDIERLTDTPILAIIPESRHTTKTPFHVLDNPKSMVSEAIRTLRTNLDFFSTNGSTKTIAISSTIAGEGKSFLALNLGGVIAMSRKKVVLLDLDMRKPKRNTPFPIPDYQKGVSTVLIGKYKLEDALVPTGLENFDYVPAGPHPPNPSELLMNNDFNIILDQLKSTYDFIIIDTPPIGLVTDGIMAMKKADVSIYVVRANYSKKDFLRNLQRVKELQKLSSMSIVFNALPTSTKLYGYGYYEDHTPIKKSWRNIIQGRS